MLIVGAICDIDAGVIVTELGAVVKEMDISALVDCLPSGMLTV
jgi:hypothetical protein